MAASRKTGRNDACPCGSGKKYKQCCAVQRQTFSRYGSILLVVLLALAAAVVTMSVRNRDASSVGPRQVWSSEHGHYHTVP